MMKSISDFVFVFSSFLFFVSCASFGSHHRNEFSTTVSEFHSHLKWKNFGKLLPIITPKNQSCFSQGFEPIKEPLMIESISIANVHWSEDKNQAKVTGMILYFIEPDMILKKGTFAEEWTFHDNEWSVQTFLYPFANDSPHIECL